MRRLALKRFRRRKSAGVLIAIAGVFAALAVGLADAPAGAWRGELVMLAATFCMSLYNVWSRPFIARSDPLAFLTAGMGAAGVMPVGVGLGHSRLRGRSAFHHSTMGGDRLSRHLRQRGRFHSLGFRAVANSPTRTAVTITVNPAFASIVGAVAIGEGIGLNLIVGLAAVAAGIWIATT